MAILISPSASHNICMALSTLHPPPGMHGVHASCRYRVSAPSSLILSAIRGAHIIRSTVSVMVVVVLVLVVLRLEGRRDEVLECAPLCVRMSACVCVRLELMRAQQCQKLK